MKRLATLSILGLTLSLAAACSSSSDSDGSTDGTTGATASDGMDGTDGADGMDGADHTDHSDHTACTGEEMAFALGQMATGAEGHFKVELVSVDPMPTIGEHTVTIKLMDSADAPVSGATFNLDQECTEENWCTNTWQHVHKHVGGSNVAVSEGEAGVYTFTKLAVVHAGSWEFRFAPSANDLNDYVVLHYCIEGDGTDGGDHSDHADHSDGDDHADHSDMADGMDMADMADAADHSDHSDADDHSDMTDMADGMDMTDMADGMDMTDMADGMDMTDGTDSTDA